MVNSDHPIYVERAGRIDKTQASFASRTTPPTGDRSHRLRHGPPDRRVVTDGRRTPCRRHRVNAIIPPLAIDGPSLTIRSSPAAADRRRSHRIRHASPSRRPISRVCPGSAQRDDLRRYRYRQDDASEVVVSDGDDERIVTIEDAAELQLDQDHLIRLESRPPNVEGRGADRIAISSATRCECGPTGSSSAKSRRRSARHVAGDETGHEGSLTTLHANSPRDALSRLETMVLMAGMDLPIRAVREQVVGGSTADRASGGSRDGRGASPRSPRSPAWRATSSRSRDLFVARAPRARSAERGPACSDRCARPAFGPASCPSSAPTASRAPTPTAWLGAP